MSSLASDKQGYETYFAKGKACCTLYKTHEKFIVSCACSQKTKIQTWWLGSSTSLLDIVMKMFGFRSCKPIEKKFMREKKT